MAGTQDKRCVGREPIMTHRAVREEKTGTALEEAGVVVFDASLHVTFVNEHARQFIHWATEDSGKAVPGRTLLLAIVMLGGRLRDRACADEAVPAASGHECRTVVSTPAGPFALHAFSLWSTCLRNSPQVMVVIHAQRRRAQGERIAPRGLRDTPRDVSTAAW